MWLKQGYGGGKAILYHPCEPRITQSLRGIQEVGRKTRARACDNDRDDKGRDRMKHFENGRSHKSKNTGSWSNETNVGRVR